MPLKVTWDLAAWGWQRDVFSEHLSVWDKWHLNKFPHNFGYSLMLLSQSLSLSADPGCLLNLSQPSLVTSPLPLSPTAPFITVARLATLDPYHFQRNIQLPQFANNATSVNGLCNCDASAPAEKNAWEDRRQRIFKKKEMFCIPTAHLQLHIWALPLEQWGNESGSGSASVVLCFSRRDFTNLFSAAGGMKMGTTPRR